MIIIYIITIYNNQQINPNTNNTYNKMHFCSNCKNMYYIKIDEDNPNSLLYYCRNCGNEDSLITEDNICVSKTQIKKAKNLLAILSINIPNQILLYLV